MTARAPTIVGSAPIAARVILRALDGAAREFIVIEPQRPMT